MNSASENTTEPQPVLPRFDAKKIIPWLPSVFVAALMVVFLAVSFVVYHYRRVRRKRAAIEYALDYGDFIRAERPSIRKFNVLRHLSGLDNSAFDPVCEDDVFSEQDVGNFSVNGRSEFCRQDDGCRNRQSEILLMTDACAVSSYEKNDPILTNTLSSKQELCSSPNSDSIEATIEPRQVSHSPPTNAGEMTAVVQIHSPEDTMPLEFQQSINRGEQGYSPAQTNHVHVDAESNSDRCPCLCKDAQQSVKGVSGKEASPTKSPKEDTGGQYSPLCIVCLITKARLRPLGVCNSCSSLKDAAFLVDVLGGSSSRVFSQPHHRPLHQQSMLNGPCVNEKAVSRNDVLTQYKSRSFQNEPCGTASAGSDETTQEDSRTAVSAVNTQRMPQAPEGESSGCLFTMDSHCRFQVHCGGCMMSPANSQCRGQASKGESSTALAAMHTQCRSRASETDTRSSVPTMDTQCKSQAIVGDSSGTVSVMDTQYRSQESQGESFNTLQSARNSQYITQAHQEDTTGTLSAMYTQSQASQDGAAGTLSAVYTQSQASQEDTTSTLPKMNTLSQVSQEDTASTLPTMYTQSQASQEDTAGTLPTMYTQSQASEEDTASTLPTTYTKSQASQDDTASTLSSMYTQSQASQEDTAGTLPTMYTQSQASQEDTASTLPTMYTQSQASQDDTACTLCAVYTQSQSSQDDTAGTFPTMYTLSQASQKDTAGTLPTMYTQSQASQEDTASTLPTTYTLCQASQEDTASTLPTMYTQSQASQEDTAGTLPTTYTQFQASQKDTAGTLPTMYTLSQASQEHTASTISAVYTECTSQASEEDTAGTLSAVCTHCRSQAHRGESCDTSSAAWSQCSCTCRQRQASDDNSAWRSPRDADVTDVSEGKAHLYVINEETCTTNF